MATVDATNVAAALAELRGEMTAGFARLEGQLNLINQAQTRNTQDIRDLEVQTAAQVRALEDRVTALEARRWPVGVIAASSGAVSAVVAGVALFVR